ncbi:hypothetical protein [Rufibacter latericius]|uniref:Lipoprotein n=1 Tax=Rufibacter latericius TaxID=2487040 RepID=A0A3M9M8K0_9BACT|nr:hypothetical protein [Rufibacter latericius]RNI21852.1 hypothetical protein EFB08_22155 [Rufibacter latericius]
MKALVKTLAYLLAFAFFTFACSEDGAEQPQPGKTINEWGQSMLQIEQIATEMELLARGIHPNGSNFLACSSVQNENTTEGLETTFTFSGASPCLDGKTRTGNIIMYTKNQPNLEVVIYLDNYQVNGAKLEGAFAFQMIQVPGKTSAIRMVSSNAQVIPATGGSFRYSLNRVTHLKEGAGTPQDASDDVVELYEAEYSCLKQNGAFEASLLAPALVKKSCVAPANIRPIQGKILIEMTTGEKTTLNYGDGTCSAKPFAE